MAKTCEAAAFRLDPRIVNSEGSSVSTQQSQFIAGNTAGFLDGFASSRHYISCAVIAAEGDAMQRDARTAQALGATRRDWRGQGHFRALTEQQEQWAIEHGFDEIVVKTKNKFYDMRGTLDHLRFEVVRYERNLSDNSESKVYLSKKLLPEMISRHRSKKAVVQSPA